ncbi:hypothetical protein [Tautonia plasticadhaerens]|uniref:Uncharacterized protein n=1 Tax=Tautonia plasticadhaerens TaxID=2527974 RepID=A0A518H0M9_9BACT|nr:hypothetical protein [Tautonia plasticadhaerens]QDV34377.1 hypothetical protein ElP_22620 [Tautonia plasticadhaerens]
MTGQRGPSGKLMGLTMVAVLGGAERTEEESRGLLEAGGFPGSATVRSPVASPW